MRLRWSLGCGIVVPGVRAFDEVMRMAQGVDYDQAAGEYAVHRRVHAGVFWELSSRAKLGPISKVLEVGCGTGNYSSALSGRWGCMVIGLDPSTGMLGQARAHPEPVIWLQGQAEALCCAGSTFDLVFSVDVIHHLTDRAAFYRAAARVLQPGGWLCTVTDSAEIIRRREVLSGYFPETVDMELARYPRLAQLEVWMERAGLVDPVAEVVEAPYEITSAQPYRDRAYSSLHLIGEEAWRAGLERLEEDLAQGPIQGSARYTCLWGRCLG